MTVSTDANGRRGVSFGVQGSAPHPAAWFAVYALPPGHPVAMIQLGGIGQRWNPAPYPNCLPVFIGSDSQGLFGHQCPACEGYWRSKAVPATWNLTCPYCGLSGETHQFLTPGQRRFVEAVCELTAKAIDADTDGEHVIDMDQVADQVAKTNERPSFYYTEETQQNHYTCAACRHLGAVRLLLLLWDAQRPAGAEADGRDHQHEDPGAHQSGGDGGT